MVNSTSPIKLFYSYSHADELFRVELEKHLSVLKRQGVISEWSDRRITAGDDWAGEINRNLETANIVLLLVSADFLASDYCYDVEMKRAMERHESGRACIIPVILRPCDWQGAPFGKLQALPTDAKPLTLWTDRDAAFADIVKGIRRVCQQPAKAIKEIEKSRSQHSSSKYQVEATTIAAARPP